MLTQEEIIISAILFVLLFGYMAILSLGMKSSPIPIVYATPDEDEELVPEEPVLEDNQAVNWREACNQLHWALFKTEYPKNPQWTTAAPWQAAFVQMAATITPNQTVCVLKEIAEKENLFFSIDVEKDTNINALMFAWAAIRDYLS